MCRHVTSSRVTCYQYSITCQDDLLTVDNAQSHVTAFRPISEAARSWSDDNDFCHFSISNVRFAFWHFFENRKNSGLTPGQNDDPVTRT